MFGGVKKVFDKVGHGVAQGFSKEVVPVSNIYGSQRDFQHGQGAVPHKGCEPTKKVGAKKKNECHPLSKHGSGQRASPKGE